jgi:hypothetical protein
MNNTVINSDIELSSTIQNNNNNDNNNDNNNKQNIQFSIYNIANCNFFNSNAFNNIIDITCIVLSISGITFGIFSCFIYDNITATGYLLSGFLSITLFFNMKKMRLRATLQTSVDVLKEENDELKENNEELKENIDDLEENNEELKESNEELKENIQKLNHLQNKLNNDLLLLKETIGVFGENYDEIINNLKTIYNNLKTENEIHSNINKNSIYLHILNIIKHYDPDYDFILTLNDLEKAKLTLLNAFPNLNYEHLKSKITNNQITAINIIESITHL